MCSVEMENPALTSKLTGAASLTLLHKTSSLTKSREKVMNGRLSSGNLGKFCGHVVSALPRFTALRLDVITYVISLGKKRMNEQQNMCKQNGQFGRSKLWCRFQERCTKGVHCEFRHFQQGFSHPNNQQNQY